MKKNLKSSCKHEDLFSVVPSANQKAWGVINEFYHLILTYMESNNINKAELSRRLGKSRSAISQMFNKTPNVSIKKMVEIADAVGIDINIISKEVSEYRPIVTTKLKEGFIFVPVPYNLMERTNVNFRKSQRYSKQVKTSIQVGQTFDLNVNIHQNLLVS